VLNVATESKDCVPIEVRSWFGVIELLVGISGKLSGDCKSSYGISMLGGGTFFFASCSQLMPLKNGWAFNFAFEQRSKRSKTSRLSRSLIRLAPCGSTCGGKHSLCLRIFSKIWLSFIAVKGEKPIIIS